MKKTLFGLLLTLLCIVPANALDGKTLGHVISIPIIEGAGIYSSIKMIKNGTPNGTAAAITNIACIGINAGMGAYTLFGKPADYAKWRSIHRVVGVVTAAAGIWLAVSAGTSSDVTNIDKGVAAGYSVMAVVPVVMFSF